MNKKRRQITNVLVVVFVLFNIFPIFTYGKNTENIDNISEFKTNTEEQIQQLIIDDVDYNNVNPEFYIKNEIPVFECYNNNNIVKVNWSLYSIVDNNDVLYAFSIKDYDESGKCISTVTKQYVDVISEYYGNDNNLAIIFDKNQAYIKSNNKLYVLAQYPDVDYRCTMKDALYNNNSNIDVLNVAISNKSTSKTKLNIQENVSRGISTSKYLNVGLQYQYKNNKMYPICWACSAASMGNYIVKKNLYTGFGFATTTYGINSGRTTTEVTKSLNLLYSATFQFYVHKTAFSFKEIINNIDAGYPLYGDFKYTSGSGQHAVVIRGYNLSNSTFGIMDPLIQNSYSYGTITSSGKLRYTRLSDGSTAENVSGIVYGGSL